MSSGWSWSVRAVIWFTVALIVNLTAHEFAHAGVAAMFGVRATLFSYAVDLHLTPEQAGTSAQALIPLAGPVFSLMLGIVSRIACTRARDTAAELPLLYFA